MKRPPTFFTLISCVLALVFTSSTRADVIWSDDFSSGTLSRDYPGGKAGPDYVFGYSPNYGSVSVNGAIGVSAPSMKLYAPGGTAGYANATVTMDQFAPFTVGPSSTTPFLRVSFDLRIDSFGGANFVKPDISFALNGIHIGYSYNSLNDGDTPPPFFSDHALYASTGTGGLTDSTAIGLIPGIGWLPGFDFGDYYTGTLGGGGSSGTNAEFYRITFLYNSITGAVTGRVTRLSTGVSAPLPSGLSLTPGTTFSSDDPGDKFQVGVGGMIYSQTYVDNIVFEALALETFTEPPVLAAPAAGAHPPSPVPVSFSLPKNALPGSVKMSFGETILTLAAAMESAGAHSFSFDPANPTSSPYIASGSPIPDGVHAVTLSYQDDIGNVGSATNENVTIERGITVPPVLTEPAEGKPTSSPVLVSFSLPENALPGSVKLSFGGTVLTLAASMENSGSHSFSFDPVSPTESPFVTSGSPIPDGVYAVTLSYRDSSGNPATGATNEHVTIHRRVTLPPLLTRPVEGAREFSPVLVSYSLPENALPGSVTLSFGGTVLTLAGIMESAGSHSFSFDPADPSFSPQVASAAGPVANGTYLVTLSYQDADGNPVASDTSSGVTIDAGTLQSRWDAPAVTLKSPLAGAVYDDFGISAAVDGTRVVVGAKKDRTNADGSGCVYVYDLSNGATVPLATLKNPNPAAKSLFGSSIAISGRWLVVGDPLSTSAPLSAPGVAYVYDLRSDTPSEPVATLNSPSPESSYRFAAAVAISGTRLVVGAPYTNENGVSGVGIAYVYDLSSGTATPMVPVLTLNNPSPGEYDYFGASVAISGTRVVVATRLSAHVYDLNSDTPTAPAVTLSSPGPSISEVAISYMRVVVGASSDDTGARDAGSAYVFDLNSVTPAAPVFTLNNPSPGEFDSFGSAVAISGTRVVVGAPGDDPDVYSYNAGRAYVYGVNGGGLVATLDYPERTGVGWNEFGSSVAISGSIAVIGAHHDGVVYIYGPDSIVTRPPVLIAPGAGTRTRSPVKVSFDLPENALPGSVKLSFGGTVLTLAATQEGAGSHSFTFDPANPTASPQIAAATGPVADGTYLVTLSYQDAQGNPAASDTSASVTIEGGALRPVLLAPAANTTPELPLQVSYTLPVAPKTGTVKLVFGTYVLTMSARGETVGGVAFSFDPANPTASPYIATGPPIPDGVYAVTLWYQDANGDSVASVTSSGVAIDAGTQRPVLLAPAANTTPALPVQVSYTLPEAPKAGTVKLAFGPNVLTISAPGETFGGGGGVAFSFDPADPTASPYIASGSRVPDGVYAVTLSYQDTAGNAVASTTNVNVTIDAVPDPASTVFFGEGSEVPASAGLPAEAVWRKFGVPAVNAAGDVVFTAEWADASGEGAAVFGTNSATGEPKVVIQRGAPAPAPGAGAEPLPTEAVVAKLRDPIVAANGDVLTPVTLAGKGITPANDGALIWSPRSNFAAARVVVHEGQALAGGKVKTITAAEVGSAGVAFTATLAGKGITGANDFIACVWTPLGGVVPVVREGQVISGMKLKHFNTLGTWAGAPGHGRGMASLDSVPLKLGFLGKFSDGQTAVLALESGGAPKVFTATGETFLGAPVYGGAFKALGLPAWAGLLASPVYCCTLWDGTKGMFQYNGDTNVSQWVAMVGAEIDPGFRLKSANDPVVSSDGTRKGWVGAVKGPNVTIANDQVIAFADGPDLSVVAREGTDAAEAPGARWKGFQSLAMPARGPLFLGSLQRGPGRITSANDVGVWGMDSTGALRCLFREGDMIGSKKLKTHTVLKAVSGTPGVTRSWNDAGQVVWLATFTDGSTAIIKTQVP